MKLPERLCQLLSNPDCPNFAVIDCLQETEGLEVAEVHLVCGETGEYSDQQSWFVAAFLDPARAEALTENLNAWLKENGLLAGDDAPRPFFHSRNPLPVNPMDLDFACDYTGTMYHVTTVPLRG